MIAHYFFLTPRHTLKALTNFIPAENPTKVGQKCRPKARTQPTRQTVDNRRTSLTPQSFFAFIQKSPKFKGWVGKRTIGATRVAREIFSPRMRVRVRIEFSRIPVSGSFTTRPFHFNGFVHSLDSLLFIFYTADTTYNPSSQRVFIHNLWILEVGLFLEYEAGSQCDIKPH